MHAIEPGPHAPRLASFDGGFSGETRSTMLLQSDRRRLGVRRPLTRGVSPLTLGCVGLDDAFFWVGDGLQSLSTVLRCLTSHVKDLVGQEQPDGDV